MQGRFLQGSSGQMIWSKNFLDSVEKSHHIPTAILREMFYLGLFQNVIMVHDSLKVCPLEKSSTLPVVTFLF